eukprot:1156756-Pelagomonas_calceolata.AAC.7
MGSPTTQLQQNHERTEKTRTCVGGAAQHMQQHHARTGQTRTCTGDVVQHACQACQGALAHPLGHPRGSHLQIVAQVGPVYRNTHVHS